MITMHLHRNQGKWLFCNNDVESYIEAFQFGITMLQLQFNRKTCFEGSMHTEIRNISILLDDFSGNGLPELQKLKAIGKVISGKGKY